MAEVKRACRECGYFTTEKVCPVCGSNAFAEKTKGKVLILDSKNSQIGKIIGAKDKGQYAIKYN